MGWVVNAIPRRLYPLKRPGTHCIGGWVGPRAGLDGAENLAPTGIRSQNHPARSESLCLQRYPGQRIARVNIFKYTNILLTVKLQVSTFEQRKKQRKYISGHNFLTRDAYEADGRVYPNIYV